jgi:SAM-dependent methyltransferase
VEGAEAGLTSAAARVPRELEGYLQPELYDLAYSWYTVDIPFYVTRARESRGPVLEVACGTGRILIPTLEAGVDIDGLDFHPGMLAVLEQRARARGLEPRVRQADMRDFTMPRRYRLVTIPFRSFMHLTTTEDQLRTLRCIKEHLEPAGALLFNLFYPNFDALVNPSHQVHQDRRVVNPANGRTVVLHTTSDVSDRVNQIKHMEREIVELDDAGRPERVHPHRFHMRWTWKYEMELLLERAGFARHEVLGGFDGKPLERDTDEMIWTAWRE